MQNVKGSFLGTIGELKGDLINSDRILQGSNLERENEGNKEEGDFRFDKVKNRIKEDGRIEVSYLTLRRSV